MMATSLKDMDEYIYSSVILPLKDVGLSLKIPSPITNDGYIISFAIGDETVRGRVEHLYQRDIARSMAGKLVYICRDGVAEYVVAAIDYRNNVKVYPRALGNIQGSGRNLLLSALVRAFNSNTPFKKVETVDKVLVDGTVNISDLPF